MWQIYVRLTPVRKAIFIIQRHGVHVNYTTAPLEFRR